MFVARADWFRLPLKLRQRWWHETDYGALEPSAELRAIMTTHSATISEHVSADTHVGSTSNERVVNNVMRHEYRVLSDHEKSLMQQVKDQGLAFHGLVSSIGTSRELALAQTKIEEAVMWAVKHITK